MGERLPSRRANRDEDLHGFANFNCRFQDELAFKPSALKAWHKQGHTVRAQIANKLAERLENPQVPGAALHGAGHVYKIKLRQASYRLVYTVEDQSVTVTGIAVGKRDRNAVYDLAFAHLPTQTGD